MPQGEYANNAFPSSSSSSPEFAQGYLGIAQPPCAGFGGEQAGVFGNGDQLPQGTSEAQCPVESHYQPAKGTWVSWLISWLCGNASRTLLQVMIDVM